MCSLNKSPFVLVSLQTQYSLYKTCLVQQREKKKEWEGGGGGGGGGGRGPKTHKGFVLKYSLQFVLDLWSEYRE